MSTLDFNNKTVLVTGASRGIGQFVARKFHELGADLILTATALTSFEGMIPDAEQHALDFTDQASVEVFIKVLDGKKVDVLVNNAGIHSLQAVGEMDSETFDKICRVNLWGAAVLCNAVAKGMKERKGGRIVNVSSIAAMVSKPGSGAYSASKAGLLGFTRSCALDMAPFNVLVNAVCPGTTQTDMVENILSDEQKKRIISHVPLKRLGNPKEVAELIVFLCSDLNTYMTGQSLIIDGGYIIQ
ncbi:MAG: SDR family NAD(P)-dependent oxidoreductase [Candidatus Omnitrophica bacterium]|nr:SDR family NAD(P)-dependent oxidoreductase [Candidatus Omnitrophota bacterium]